MISTIEAGSVQFTSLIHLGVSYNQLDDDSLTKLVSVFPKLFCLDISHNRLESMIQTLRSLILLQDLKMLYMLGNPLVLVPNYRQVLKTKFNKLRMLDGTPTLNEAEGTKKKKPAKSQTSMLSTYSKSTQGPDLEALVEGVSEDFTLDLHLRVLQNIDGIYLTEETCKPEVLETLQNDQEKSSVYWLSYTDHQDKVVETEKKVWIQHFSVDKEAGVGKTDFGFKIRISERPSYTLSEWMRKDLVLELWETRPKLVEKRNEETLEMVKEVVLDANNIPVIEKRSRGVSFLLLTSLDLENQPERVALEA
jgi:Leucine-rich repeat (LRR) protein